MEEQNIEDLYKTVKKLVGPIEPVGETYQDAVRFENLKVMVGVVDKLLADIDQVSMINHNRIEYSRALAGKFASKFLDKIGIKS